MRNPMVGVPVSGSLAQVFARMSLLFVAGPARGHDVVLPYLDVASALTSADTGAACSELPAFCSFAAAVGVLVALPLPRFLGLPTFLRLGSASS